MSDDDFICKVKGYCIEPKTSDAKALSPSRKHEIEKRGFSHMADAYVSPKIVTSVTEYIAYWDELTGKLENLYEFPLFARGQGNSRYIANPTVLRTDPAREHRLYEDFIRRFPNEIRRCENTIDKLQLMQHFRLQTRILDLSENPLVALYFAVAPSKKYPTVNSQSENSSWGEISFFRNEDKDGRNQKSYIGDTVTILANIARLKETFSLEQLEVLYMQDGHPDSVKEYIYVRHYQPLCNRSYTVD